MPRRKQESNFFLTINSNKTPDNPENKHLVVTRMEAMLTKLANERVLATYLKFGPKADEYKEDVYADVIHSVDWKAAVETGDVMKRVHAHVWLTITHYSQIQINVQMLMYQAKAAYNEGLREHWSNDGQKKDPLRMNRQPYVHVKLLPQGDWTSVMRQYIHKGMTAA